MLVLKRHAAGSEAYRHDDRRDRIAITTPGGERIVIQIIESARHFVRVGVSAPKSCVINRLEIDPNEPKTEPAAEAG